MEGSTIQGWLGLGSAALAAGALVRSRVRPTNEDLHPPGLMEAITALWLGLSLTPVEEAFTVQGDFLAWCLLALRIGLVVFVFSQFRRAWVAQPADSNMDP